MTRVATGAVAVLAVAVTVALVATQRQIDGCQSAVANSGQALRSRSDTVLDRAADRLLRECRGSQTAGRAAGFYGAVGRTQPAESLARRVVAREPRSYEGWAALSLSARKIDPALAARARARALELNPRAGGGS